MTDRIIRRPEVERLTGLSTSTIYDWISQKTFPAPVRLGARMVGWRESEIETWIDAQEARACG
ncbi:MAG: AlpA family transcriptional regulator [Hyphomonas sp.]|uniref:helix-turn-helix transcriptional regulator n=1 Tax=Hyphomonas sp. TaxID=87 RepID=UPI001B1C3B9F|nr:AlpA family transcriptional regulator [Hyphomonas sp.]MBO6581988.1 AlpA family transcriptional regulator [Hyphomonas sp.]